MILVLLLFFGPSYSSGSHPTRDDDRLDIVSNLIRVGVINKYFLPFVMCALVCVNDCAFSASRSELNIFLPNNPQLFNSNIVSFQKKIK